MIRSRKRLFTMALLIGLTNTSLALYAQESNPRPANSASTTESGSAANTQSGSAPQATGAAGNRQEGAQNNGNRQGGAGNAGNRQGATGQASQGGGRPNAGGQRGRGRPPALVVTEPVSEALINDRLKAVGSGKAVASVSVVPLSDGLLTEVLVVPGQRVKKGDVLATIDDAEALIARDRAARTAADAAVDENRLARLFRSNTTTEVELNRAKAALADADLALREAELTLERRGVKAPIAGIVGFVSVDAGNYVTTQTELVTVDDRSTILVEFWIPERFANQVTLNQPVEAMALAIPGKTYQGVVSAIGSRIETDSRTLPLQAKIDNSSDSLRPGMSFEVILRFPGETYPAIDPLAVQWDSSGSYVWRISEDKAQRVPVQIIQRNPESVLVNADIATGDLIVTEGLLSLRPGAAVRLQGNAP